MARRPLLLLLLVGCGSPDPEPFTETPLALDEAAAASVAAAEADAWEAEAAEAARQAAAWAATHPTAIARSRRPRVCAGVEIPDHFFQCTRDEECGVLSRGQACSNIVARRDADRAMHRLVEQCDFPPEDPVSCLTWFDDIRCEEGRCTGTMDGL